MTQNIPDMSKSRIFEFDLLKFLAIFLVICGHSIMHLSSADRQENMLYGFIYSFHMPLFMLISGFFSARSMDLAPKDLFKKKFLQLIYPTITFGLIFFTINLIIGWNQFNDYKIWMFDMFWFLRSCFLCYIGLFICLKLFRNKKILACLFALAISQVLPFYKMTWMFPFFIAGYLLNGSYDWIRKNSYMILLTTTIAFIVLFILYSNLLPSDLMQLKSELLNGNFSSLPSFLSFQVARLLIGAMGSLMIMSIVNIVSSKLKDSKLLITISEYGKHTLGIYIIQTFILEILMSRLLDLTHINPLIFNFILVPLISFVVLDISYMLVRLSKKTQLSHKILWNT